MIFRLKSENNKANCCKYHLKQNLNDIIEDCNWVKSKAGYKTIKFICRVCFYERIYEVVETLKPIKTLL